MKQLLPFVCLTLLLALSASCKPNSEERLKIDHLILAVNDLELGMKQFEERTGIRPKYGGGHPNGDTHNATVALANGIYVEILAPKEGLDSIPAFFREKMELTPIGFAMSSNDLVKLEQEVKGLGYTTTGIEKWSRLTPNEEKLEWELLMINDDLMGMTPFFIKWKQATNHPSKAKNIQISLRKLNLHAPKNRVVELVEKRGDSIVSKKFNHVQAETLTMNFSLDTPKGMISFK